MANTAAALARTQRQTRPLRSDPWLPQKPAPSKVSRPASVPLDIAMTHGLSVHTTGTQLNHAMAKAGVHTQAGLVARVCASK